MPATYEEVEMWKVEGIKKGATHIVSMCDTFSYEDYPIFVMPEEDVYKVAAEYSGSAEMQKVNEIIELSKEPKLIHTPDKLNILELNDNLTVLLESTEWCPTYVGGNSVMHMVEVKAMLLNAQKKLNKLIKNEGLA